MNQEDMQIIGTLALEKDTKRKGVFINTKSAIQYVVKSMMSDYKSDKLFTGYMNSFENDQKFDDEYRSDEERVEKFWDHIYDKLFIYNFKANDGEFERMTKVHLVNKPVKFNEDEYFKGVPVFSADTDEIVREWELESQWSLYRNYNTLDEFCDCIKAKQPLGSIYGYDATENQPSFVIWKNQNQKLYVIGKIANCRYNSQRGLILEKEGQELLKIDISDQAEKIVYDVDANPTLAFVPETIYKQIEDQILKAEVERTKKLEAKKKEPVTKQNQEKAESFTETVNDAQEELKEVNTKEYSDELLIQMMDYHSQKRNLFYNMKDFVNVHTAIKCSNLVILSGLSGTGKSALVEIYARALGIRNNLEDDRLLFVPVRPSWNDDADLLGYVDLVHNVYRPSDTGFVDFLVNAQKEENKGKLFIVCFDEMNLARVEHYFSQFLSLLERPENQRELQLYDSQYAGQLYNSATYPSKIIIGDNIRFIGTVNIDESTYHFSDKVLDRANVIELDVLDYSKEWTKKQYASLITPTWSKDEYDALLIQRFPGYKESVGSKFSMNERDIWENGFYTLAAEENETLEVLFDSADKNARLYLEALDVMPYDDKNLFEDEEGRLYRTVSPESFLLCSSDSTTDTLRVDSFKMSIYCNEKWYYGVLNILPKAMSKKEWKMMKDDLEKEVRGLAQDIIQKNIGIGNKNIKIPPRILYDFMILKKYSKRVIMALMNIAENPKCEIVTEYENVSLQKNNERNFDAATMRRYATRSGCDARWKIPVKRTCYDIQENRLLKNMLQEYDDKLVEFIAILDNAESFNMEEESNKEMLLEFRETAEKLKKVTAILKAQEWFGKVGKLSGPYIPHSFILDTRYNTIYQMHMELKQNEVQIHLNPEFDYTWKRSSYLYEMWCFFKVCHFCFEKLDLEYSDWNFDLKGEVFFPFLKEGTMVRFSNPVIRVDVVYDQCLPLEKEATDINHPLYIAKQHGDHRNHNRPDIVLNVYDNERNVYLGSIILECKYRKLHSFWSEDSTRSSRGQLEAYYNNARSSHLLAGLGESFNIRPISKVLALSPDDRADGLEQEDFGIEIKTFKPTEDGREEHINQWIFEEIVNLEKRYDKFWRIIWPDEQAEVHFV